MDPGRADHPAGRHSRRRHRLAHELYGVEPGYPWVLGSLVAGDWTGIAAIRLPLVVWLHACIGLHFAWRLKPWYRTWLPLLYAIALLVPVGGIAGAAIALRDVADLAQQPGFLANLFARVHVPTQEGIDNLYAISRNLQIGALVLLAGAERAALLRDLWSAAPVSSGSTTTSAAASPSRPASPSSR